MPISLTDFKRPPQDNGRGLHGSAATSWTGGEQGLDYWIAELQALGVKWFKVLDDSGDSLPLCQKLLAAGIFPVVRIIRRDPPPSDSPEPNPGHLNSAEEQTIKRLIDAGVLYFETNNEPNLTTEWKNGAIPENPQEAAKLVALSWLFDARFILNAGGYPALPAISVGQELDLMGALTELGRQDILLEGCWIAIHNFGLNHPLDYPDDTVAQTGESLTYEQYDFGPFTTWAWWNLERARVDTRDDVNRMRESSRKPGQTIQKDHACFREFVYYDTLAQKYLGRSIPILSTAGGYLIGRREDPRYPRVTPQMQADLTAAIFDFMQRRAPDYYFANMPWLMLPSASWQPDAWYGDFWQRAFITKPRTSAPIPGFGIPGLHLDTNLPVITAVKSMPNVPRFGAPPLVKPVPTAVYIIQRGDTLSALAKRFGTNVTTLAHLNNISDPSRIAIGQRLIVPAVTQTIPPPPPLPKPPAPPRVATSSVPMSPPPPPKPSNIAQFDPRLRVLGVQILNTMVVPGLTYWKLVRAGYDDPNESGGEHYIQYTILDENGAPLSDQRVMQSWGADKSESYTDTSGQAKIALAASYSPERGELGPYTVWVDGLPSDRVTGLGLPLNRPVNFRLTWQKTIK